MCRASCRAPSSNAILFVATRAAKETADHSCFSLGEPWGSSRAGIAVRRGGEGKSEGREYYYKEKDRIFKEYQ